MWRFERRRRSVLKSCVKKQTIQPAKHLTGGVQPPGDKSISHRYAMLAGLAEGTSELRNFSAAADCHSTLGCMSALGAEVKVEKDLVRVIGRGPRGLKSSWRALDAGNSGTTMRLLAGILAGQEFTTKLTGDSSLQKRPMKRVVGPLREMGADIRAKDDNFAPLEIKAARLHAIDYQMPMASAQVKSAVLLAGLYAEGVTSVTEPAGTRDHTELALEEFGAAIERQGRTTKIHGLFGGNGSGKLVAKSLDVPGDISSAVFFIAAASLLVDSNIAIHNVGLNPTRTAILDLFAGMGASIQMLSLKSSHGEIIGDLAVKGASLKGGVIEGETIPLVIDELPMLAALGPFTEEGIEIRERGGTARERERPHRCARRKFATYGRDCRRAAGWIEGGGPARGKTTWGRDRAAWGSSDCDGICRGRAGCGGRNRDSRCGLRGRLCIQHFLRI